MTINAHDAIVDAVLAALRASPALADGQISDSVDFTSLPEDVSKAIVVGMLSSDPARGAIAGAPTDWRTTVRLDCYARSDKAVNGSRASRVLHSQAYARLQADPSLGGVAFDIDEPTLTADSELFGSRLGCLLATYTVSHRTRARSLEV